jgi:hypothetical protein
MISNNASCCGVCDKADGAKYRCPACRVVTCSLECSKCVPSTLAPSHSSPSPSSSSSSVDPPPPLRRLSRPPPLFRSPTTKRRHKSDTGCTGKRKKTEFVKLGAFTDGLLAKDLHLLEETARVRDGAVRIRSTLSAKEWTPPLTAKLKTLIRQAIMRRTVLTLMPPSMHQRRCNTSFFHPKKGVLFWRCEWRFPQVLFTLSSSSLFALN